MANFATNDTPTTEQFNEIAQGALDSDTIASSASLVISDEFVYTVTGTTQIDSFAPTVDRVGDRIVCLFQEQLLLNPANTGNIKFPGAHESRGFRTLPNTICEFQRVGSNWYMINTNLDSIRPFWKVRPGSTQAIGAGATNTIQHDTIVYSNYTSYFDTASKAIDIPYDGVYSLSASVELIGNTAAVGDQIAINIRVNSTIVVRSIASASSASVGVNVNGVRQMAAGESVDVTLSNSVGQTLTTANLGSGTSMDVYLMEFA